MIETVLNITNQCITNLTENSSILKRLFAIICAGTLGPCGDVKTGHTFLSLVFKRHVIYTHIKMSAVVENTKIPQGQEMNRQTRNHEPILYYPHRHLRYCGPVSISYGFLLGIFAPPFCFLPFLCPTCNDANIFIIVNNLVKSFLFVWRAYQNHVIRGFNRFT